MKKKIITSILLAMCLGCTSGCGSEDTTAKEEAKTETTAKNEDTEKKDKSDKDKVTTDEDFIDLKDCETIPIYLYSTKGFAYGTERPIYYADLSLPKDFYFSELEEDQGKVQTEAFANHIRENDIKLNSIRGYSVEDSPIGVNDNFSIEIKIDTEPVDEEYFEYVRDTYSNGNSLLGEKYTIHDLENGISAAYGDEYMYEYKAIRALPDLEQSIGDDAEYKHMSMEFDIWILPESIKEGVDYQSMLDDYFLNNLTLAAPMDFSILEPGAIDANPDNLYFDDNSTVDLHMGGSEKNGPVSDFKEYFTFTVPTTNVNLDYSEGFDKDDEYSLDSINSFRELEKNNIADQYKIREVKFHTLNQIGEEEEYFLEVITNDKGLYPIELQPYKNYAAENNCTIYTFDKGDEMFGYKYTDPISNMPAYRIIMKVQDATLLFEYTKVTTDLDDETVLNKMVELIHM